jgi:hypothetical protein
VPRRETLNRQARRSEWSTTHTGRCTPRGSPRVGPTLQTVPLPLQAGVCVARIKTPATDHEQPSRLGCLRRLLTLDRRSVRPEPTVACGMVFASSRGACVGVMRPPIGSLLRTYQTALSRSRARDRPAKSALRMSIFGPDARGRGLESHHLASRKLPISRRFRMGAAGFEPATSRV